MGKFDEVLAKAQDQMNKIGQKYDDDLYRKVAKGCGPSIYNRDASSVATSQKTELETVKKNFVMNKLGVTDEAIAQAAVEKVAAQMKDAKNKSRINFYYLLVKELGKENKY